MQFPLLELEHVEKSFNAARILSNVTYTFREGQKYVLMGTNGSGKTTLLNAISGFIGIDSGRIRFKGNDIRKCSPSRLARQGISRTFQSVKIFGSLTVADNLLVALRGKPDEHVWHAVFGTPSSRVEPWRGRIEASLDAYGLKEYRHQLAGELSFGQQKLLQFVMATINTFDWLLLDEPVASLAPSFIQDRLRRLCILRNTIIVVEHNLEFIRHLDAEVLFLAQGEIIASGTLQEVMADTRVRRAYL